MATILNPTPVTASTFGGMWITQLQVFFPVEGQKGFINCKFLPYDGTNLLATGGRDFRLFDLATKRQSDPQLDTMLTNLQAELARQSQRDVDQKFLAVIATDPSKPVVANVFFVDKKIHRIANCFALASTDAQFAAVLTATMAEIARQAGLSISA